MKTTITNFILYRLVLFTVIAVVILLMAHANANAEEQPLWKLVVAEAANQGYEGMYAVTCVVRNRVQADMTIGLSAAHRRDLDRFVSAQPQTVQDTARTIVDIVANGGGDTTNGALYFENINAYGWPEWTKGKHIKVLKVINDHTFFKEASCS